jgi:hypothetical protein
MVRANRLPRMETEQVGRRIGMIVLMRAMLAKAEMRP